MGQGRNRSQTSQYKVGQWPLPTSFMLQTSSFAVEYFQMLYAAVGIVEGFVQVL